MEKPLFDDRLAIAARDADDRDVELLPVVPGQGLQCRQCVPDQDKTGAGIVLCPFRRRAHHEISQPLLIEFRDVKVAVVALADQGEEHGVLGGDQLTAVDEDIPDGGFRRAFAHDLSFEYLYDFR